MVKQIPSKIETEDETLELMGRYDFHTKTINLDRLKQHIENQIKKLDGCSVVVLVYLSEEAE